MNKKLWQTLPQTPDLPASENSGYANINDIRLWFAEYGEGMPVILVHGGMDNSNHWGNLVPELLRHYRVIVMDSRGQGRSTLGNKPSRVQSKIDHKITTK